jgi:hypothetical protein
MHATLLALATNRHIAEIRTRHGDRPVTHATGHTTETDGLDDRLREMTIGVRIGHGVIRPGGESTEAVAVAGEDGVVVGSCRLRDGRARVGREELL